jgi:hypothetical protein
VPVPRFAIATNVAAADAAGSHTRRDTSRGRWLAHSLWCALLPAAAINPSRRLRPAACAAAALHASAAHFLQVGMSLSCPPLFTPLCQLQACGLPERYVPNMLLAVLWASQVGPCCICWCCCAAELADPHTECSACVECWQVCALRMLCLLLPDLFCPACHCLPAPSGQCRALLLLVHCLPAAA